MNVKIEKNIVFLIKIALMAIFILTPLLFYTKSPYPYVTPKIIFFQVMVVFAFALWLSLIVFFKKYRPAITPLTISLTVFLFISFLAAYNGADWRMSLWDVIDRKMGLVAILHFFILFLILSSLYKERVFYQFTRAIIYSSIGVSVITLLQRFTAVGSIIPTENITQPSGAFSNSLFLGSYLIFTIFFGLWLFFSEKEKSGRYISLASIVLGITALFITEARGAIIGFTIGIIALLIYLSIYGNRIFASKHLNARKISAVILIFILLFSFSFWLTKSADLWKSVPGFNRLASSTAKTNLDNRIAQWESGLNAFKEHKFLGWGWNNFNIAQNKFNVPAHDGTTRPSFFGRTNKPFNVFIEHLISGGLMELISYILVLVMFFYQLFKTEGVHKPFIGALMIAYLVQSLGIFDTIATYPLLFFLLAFIDVKYKSQRVQSDTNKSAIILSPLKFILVAIFLLFAFLLLTYRLNFATLRAEHNQYLAEINSDSNLDVSLMYWKKSLQIYNPYHSQLSYKFALSARKIIDLSAQNEQLFEFGKTAARELEIITKKSPYNYDYIFALVNIYNSLSLYDKSYIPKAEYHIKRAFELASNNPEIYIALAKTRLLQNDANGSLEALKMAKDIDVKMSDPNIILAVLYRQIGELEKSNGEIDKLIHQGISPQYIEENILFGDIKINKQEFGNAIKFYTEALKAKPSSNQILFVDAGLNYNVVITAIKLRLAFAYYNDGQKEEAVKVITSISRKITILRDGKDQSGLLEYYLMFKDLGFAR